MLIFKKMINNNVALVDNSDGKEYVIVGKGIAFQRKAGDLISEENCEKQYSLLEDENRMLLDYFKDIDYKLFIIGDRVKKYIEDEFNLVHTNYMYLSLLDHINGSLTRMKMGMTIDSEVTNEDLKYYPRAYALSVFTNRIIKEELDVDFDENELGFLTLHFIGILYDMRYTQLNERALTISNDILGIITNHIGAEKMQGFAVERLIIHLKFFVVRQFNKGEASNETFDYTNDLYQMLTKQNPEAERILLEIIKYLEGDYNFKVSLDEWLYLLIHIVKVIK